jgi:hypothetical protein
MVHKNQPAHLTARISQPKPSWMETILSSWDREKGKINMGHEVKTVESVFGVSLLSRRLCLSLTVKQTNIISDDAPASHWSFQYLLFSSESILLGVALHAPQNRTQQKTSPTTGPLMHGPTQNLTRVPALFFFSLVFYVNST